ncbi:MAG: metallophosphoesterase [Clostridia bacterium]|nr:metallophosphoesterase [Clostridia bacterium]
MREWIQMILIGVCILCALIMMACMVMMQRARKLIATRKEINGSGEPCTFVLLSDIHIANMPIPVRQIAAAVKNVNPDFIVITGDLCNRLEETGRAAYFVENVAQSVQVPIFITFGNHENKIFEGKPDLRKAYIRELSLLSPRIKILEEEAVTYGNALIGGLNDVRTNAADVAALVSKWGKMAQENNLSFVLATHNADMLLRLESVPAELRPHITVCGHTHGGQIRTPFNLEFTLLKEDRLPKEGYIYGLHDYKGFPLYVTSGLGCSLLPIRFGSFAEIAIFHLS